jgi:3-oxoacyl-[acyl-carrier-protein] synthase-3
VLAAPFLAAEYSPDHLNLVGQGWGLNTGSNHKITMAGGANVLRHAVRTMQVGATNALEASDLTWDDVDFVIPHQANERITVSLERVLKLKKGKVIHAIEDIGNVSASTVPITLDRLLHGEFGDLPDPSQIVLTAVGGGYASGAVAIEWSPGE